MKKKKIHHPNSLIFKLIHEKWRTILQLWNKGTTSFKQKYNEYKQILEELQTKIIELGHDKDEHTIVIKH
ncbi:CRE_collapsed_G0013810.mRNA.1.CDS.1 [Saccharomyces cerevisiae]|nr:CRE_collapsed_G0013810.mRNA.1.CDS.1 [Saccharomyces cerevisiae]